MLILLQGCSLFINKKEVVVVDSIPVIDNTPYKIVGKTKEETKKNALKVCSRIKTIEPIKYDREKKIYTYTIKCVNKNKSIKNNNPLIEAF